METNSWHTYPKVWGFGHPQVQDIFKGPVLLQEKIDGSQFSFARFGKEILVKSKSCQLDFDVPEKMFQAAVDTVRKLDLVDGWTYRAEYLRTPKHNVLSYSRIPKDHLILFDINTNYETYLPYCVLKAEAEQLELECVPLFYLDTISPESIKSLLKETSILGGTQIEGIVVKNYGQFGKDGKCLMAKFVSEEFKETANTNGKQQNPGKGDIIELLVASLNTPARWEKAVQALRDSGKLDSSPKDIFPLMNQVKDDIQVEARALIMESLYNWSIGNILRGSVRGLPEWYKERLLEKQFAGIIGAIRGENVNEQE